MYWDGARNMITKIMHAKYSTQEQLDAQYRQTSKRALDAQWEIAFYACDKKYTRLDILELMQVSHL